jgi:hypothetical protein
MTVTATYTKFLTVPSNVVSDFVEGCVQGVATTVVLAGITTLVTGGAGVEVSGVELGVSCVGEGIGKALGGWADTAIGASSTALDVLNDGEDVLDALF